MKLKWNDRTRIIDDHLDDHIVYNHVAALSFIIEHTGSMNIFNFLFVTMRRQTFLASWPAAVDLLPAVRSTPLTQWSVACRGTVLSLFPTCRRTRPYPRASMIPHYPNAVQAAVCRSIFVFRALLDSWMLTVLWLPPIFRQSLVLGSPNSVFQMSAYSAEYLKQKFIWTLSWEFMWVIFILDSP
jgi:hypothetical protein